MKVLVDTSVWSLALRRRDPDPAIVRQLKDLISESRLIIIGPIRQELLSGIKSSKQFENLRQRLAAFSDHPINQADY